MIASAKPPPELKKRILSTRQLQQPKILLGKSGESQAATFLIQKGFLILETNVRYRNNEIDIVAVDKKLNEIAFIEVKTRTGSFFGEPSLAVDSRKLRSMRLVAQAFLKRRLLDNDYRFDIISVLPGSIEHLINVSWSR